MLKDLARVASLTVAMVIHQPRVEIWNQLDELLLLAPGGLTVYQGPQKLAVQYFASRFDVRMSPHENPADALMDRIAEQGDDFVAGWKNGGPEYLAKLRRERHHDNSAEESPIVVPGEDEGDGAAASSTTPGTYSALMPHVDAHAVTASASVKVHIGPRKESPDQLFKALTTYQSTVPTQPPAFIDNKPLRVTASFWRQLQLAFVRSLWKQAANTSSLVLEVGLGMLAGVIMGSMITMTYIGIFISPYSQSHRSRWDGARVRQLIITHFVILP